jgi:ArsR family transcriptional regulator
MESPARIESLSRLLGGLRAVAEPTRLRLLVLCAAGEWAVSELTQILGQSQPRVSRHLRLLTDAGLLVRFREGSWTFYRLTPKGALADLAAHIVALLPDDTELQRDRDRSLDVKRMRAKIAADYFRRNAGQWERLRSLHVPEARVEAVMLELCRNVPAAHRRNLLDIGTGTGRILEVFAPHVDDALGVDLSCEMLAIARANLERAGLDHCQIRQGDMYKLPLPDKSYDLVTVHQVLHYADRPADVIREAARVLRPEGRLIIVDFMPHALEKLRDAHAHRRLGFPDAEIKKWCAAAGLKPGRRRKLPGDPLTVAVWHAIAPTDTDVKQGRAA